MNLSINKIKYFSKNKFQIFLENIGPFIITETKKIIFLKNNVIFIITLYFSSINKK